MVTEALTFCCMCLTYGIVNIVNDSIYVLCEFKPVLLLYHTGYKNFFYLLCFDYLCFLCWLDTQ